MKQLYLTAKIIHGAHLLIHRFYYQIMFIEYRMITVLFTIYTIAYINTDLKNWFKQSHLDKYSDRKLT